MTRVDKILALCADGVRSPVQTAAAEMERTGKRAVGCMLEFCPEEIVYAADMLPVGLWGVDIELREVKRYFPAFFCAPIQQSMELALQGAFDGVLSAVIVPILCDALKSAGQNWRIAVPEIPMIPVVYPQNRQIKAGQRFMESELREVKARLEQICGRPISEDALNRSINVYNEYRLSIQEFSSVASRHTDVITASARHNVFMNGFLRDKADYTMLVRELTSELKKLPEVKPRRAVALTGIALDTERVLRCMEENGFAVTADMLAQESLQVETLVPENGSALERIAAWWSNVRCSSLTLDEKKLRADKLVEFVSSGLADGIIVAMPAFCDPEEYDYPILCEALQQKGIAQIGLELSGPSGCEQACSRIQAFAEMFR